MYKRSSYKDNDFFIILALRNESALIGKPKPTVLGFRQ